MRNYSVLEKQIRCKCGKEYGITNFRRKKKCKRCQTIVIARGKIGENNEIN